MVTFLSLLPAPKTTVNGSGCFRYGGEKRLPLFFFLLFYFTAAEDVDTLCFLEHGGNPSLQAIQVRSAF